MFSMQYNIKLPADYDMDIIKRRVNENGFQTDGFQDLQLKAYLIAEKKKYNNLQNEYAPFYVWSGIKGMNEFLLNGPFNNIIRSFGWTLVNTWSLLHCSIHKSTIEQYAIVKKERINPVQDFSELISRQQRLHYEQIENTYVNANTIAYNPLSWELCNLIISEDLDYLQSLGRNELIYDVQHIS